VIVFEIESCFLLEFVCHDPPIPVAGMTSMHHHTQHFLLRWSLTSNVLPGLAWNHDLPDHHLVSGQRYWREPPSLFCRCFVFLNIRLAIAFQLHGFNGKSPINLISAFVDDM
jgi:hypothetical protein